MNTWNGSGNVATAPTLRYTTTSGKAVINFNIAIRENIKDKETTFVTVTAWDKLAEACNQYVHKGDFIIIKGHIRCQNYTDKENIKRILHFIEAEQIEFDPRNAAVKSNNEVNPAAGTSDAAANESTNSDNQSATPAPFGSQPANQYEEDIPF